MGLFRCGIERNGGEEAWQFAECLVTPNQTKPYWRTLHLTICKELSDPGSASSWPVLIRQSRKVSDSIMATTIPYLNTPYHTLPDYALGCAQVGNDLARYDLLTLPHSITVMKICFGIARRGMFRCSIVWAGLLQSKWKRPLEFSIPGCKSTNLISRHRIFFFAWGFSSLLCFMPSNQPHLSL